MALNIKDPVAERLVGEIAVMAGETKTEAVRTALAERLERLVASRRHRQQAERLTRFLEEEAWPQLPADVLSTPMSKPEREAILGYGPEGV